MVFNPATDFLGLWRNIAGNVSKLEMPGLDYVVAALGRAGVVNVTVSATAPVANQATTAWLKAAVPSYSAEGALFLWDKVTTAYLAATPALFLQFLEASAGQNGVSWWTVTGGAPLNTVGNNGDFALRTDAPNGVYGPKAAGAWPATPVPGTADIITSTSLDNTFGAVQGSMIFRDVAAWATLPVGAPDAVIVSNGTRPLWASFLIMLGVVLGTVRGSIPFYGAASWTTLAPGTAGQVLTANGAGADPTWAPRTAEFPSGTAMLFQQSAAPPGWAKQTALNDYGLRVTSGAVGTVSGSAFSSVFAQTAVGNTTITQTTMPSHTHGTNAAIVGTNQAVNSAGAVLAASPGATIASSGADGAHTHSINLTLSYVDVIIAVKN